MNKTFLKALEIFALRAFLIVISFQLFTLFVIVFGSDNIANLHGKIIGIPDERMSQFEYDWKIQMFFFVGFFKVSAIVFFGIPWAVLRFSKKFKNDDCIENKAP